MDEQEKSGIAAYLEETATTRSGRRPAAEVRQYLEDQGVEDAVCPSAGFVRTGTWEMQVVLGRWRIGDCKKSGLTGTAVLHRGGAYVFQPGEGADPCIVLSLRSWARKYGDTSRLSVAISRFIRGRHAPRCEALVVIEDDPLVAMDDASVITWMDEAMERDWTEAGKNKQCRRAGCGE